MESSNVPPRGSGWLSFAAVMIGLVGVFNIIWGLVALIQDDYFVADELLFADLSLWGVIYLIIGGIQLLTAGLIASRNPAGAVIGIFMASVSAIGALLSVGAYPLWSIIIMVIDGLVIYGLAVYGFGEE
jgi:hypothetical protein